MAESSIAPTTLASRELPSAMLFDLPRKPASTGAALIDSASADRDAAAKSNASPLDGRYHWPAPCARRDIPDRSMHSVSPCALSAALHKFTDVGFPDTDDDESEIDGALRKYKRARIDETSAWFDLKGGPPLPEAGPSTELHIKKEASASTKAGEDSYWDGAFNQVDTIPAKLATEGTSQNARRLLFEYGRRTARHAPALQLSRDGEDASASSTLPHRPRNPEPVANAVNGADSLSEDEGFAIVQHPQATGNSTPDTQMSSPELIPFASIAEIIVKDENISDDDWTDVEPLN